MGEPTINIKEREELSPRTSRRQTLATRIIALALALVAGLTVAACGSSGKSSASSTSPPSGASSTPGSASASATKSPIPILVESSVNTPAGTYPGVFGGAAAAAKAVNATGGINGHPLKMIDCNSQLTPNGAVACARQAISDKVVAYLGFGALIAITHPIVYKAGIPQSVWIVNETDVNDPGTYPLGGAGSVTEYIGAVFAALKSGSKSTAIAYTNYPGVLQGVDLEKTAAKNTGLAVRGVAVTSLTQTDLSSTAQQLKSTGATSVLMVLPSPQVAALILAAKAIGYNPTWVGINGSFTVATLKQISDLTPNLWVASVTPSFLAPSDHSIPAVNQYDSEMDSEATSDSNAAVANRGVTSFSAWATTHAFAQVMKTMTGAITANTLMATLNKTTNVNVLGLWNWSPGGTGPKGFTRITDGGANLYIGPVKGGYFAPVERIPVLTKAGL